MSAPVPMASAPCPGHEQILAHLRATLAKQPRLVVLEGDGEQRKRA